MGLDSVHEWHHAPSFLIGPGTVTANRAGYLRRLRDGAGRDGAAESAACRLEVPGMGGRRADIFLREVHTVSPEVLRYAAPARADLDR